MKIRGKEKYPILTYMLGFFVGILYLNRASGVYLMDAGIWGEWFRSQYLTYDLKVIDYMWYVAEVRILPAGILALLGRTKLRKVGVYLFLCWMGFASGAIFTSAVLALAVKGLILCIVSIFPHFLCYVPAYTILLVHLLHFSERGWSFTKTISFLLLLMMGIAMECLVNPVLLKIFLKTL